MNHWLTFIRFLASRLAIYLAAVAVAYLLVTITATQSVVSSLGDMGVSVNFPDRIAMTLQDIGGMAGMLLPMVAFGLLVAFMTAALICRYRPGWRKPLYLLAGAAAVVCMHLALNLAFAVTPIAIARTGVGLLLQGLAGAAGGMAYLYLSDRYRRKSPI